MRRISTQRPWFAPSAPVTWSPAVFHDLSTHVVRSTVDQRAQLYQSTLRKGISGVRSPVDTKNR